MTKSILQNLLKSKSFFSLYDALSIDHDKTEEIKNELDTLVNENYIKECRSTNGMIIYVKIPSSERIKLSLQMKIDSLQQEVDEKMDELEIIDIENEYKDYLNLVHTYNDLKDAGQKIIGILAVNKGVTSRELYKDFDLNIDD
ncbi:hypothetical protein O9G_000906 [Rozella allomycis CSF55]|uniref:Swi5-domain-containing protein n=2 Tax=Rozella allomycis (strain CSF55) TaxID=988480 RepID=A0A075ARB8_ROZAC|nr:hypothetical protein O9G_000906 [Rozella allomycis CSF55]|eukprot:EPZ31261.1 hypothetical protein O9G_000906 [Rozella allomycis CSF55]